MKERKAKEPKIRDRFVKLKSSLSERARRLFVANEAIAFGYGGIAAASRATGMAASVRGDSMRCELSLILALWLVTPCASALPVTAHFNVTNATLDDRISIVSVPDFSGTVTLGLGPPTRSGVDFLSYRPYGNHRLPFRS